MEIDVPYLDEDACLLELTHDVSMPSEELEIASSSQHETNDRINELSTVWPPTTGVHHTHWRSHSPSTLPVLGSWDNGVAWIGSPDQRALRAEMRCPTFVRELTYPQAADAAPPLESETAMN